MRLPPYRALMFFFDLNCLQLPKEDKALICQLKALQPHHLLLAHHFCCCFQLCSSSVWMKRTPLTGGLIITRIYSSILETGKSKFKVQADSVSDKSLFLVQRLWSSHWCHMAEEGEGAPWGLFNMSTNPIHKSSHSWPNYLPKAHLQISSQWGLGFSIMNSRGTHSLLTIIMNKLSWTQPNPKLFCCFCQHSHSLFTDSTPLTLLWCSTFLKHEQMLPLLSWATNLMSFLPDLFSPLVSRR